MSLAPRPALVRWSIAIAATLLFLVGILHAVMNERSLRRLMARGVLAERFGTEMVANVVLGGAMLSLLGIILLLVAFGPGSGSRALWWIGLLVGLFLVAFGVAGYLLYPVPSVFLFSALGLLVCVPMLLRREGSGTG
jgi:hypothetical protein